MARIQIPIDALTSRLNLGSRFEGVRSQSLSTRFANLRSISEFLNLSRLSKPANFGEVQSRVNYNLGYFSSNYVAVGIMLLIYSLLTNLTLLFDIIFVGLGLFAIKKLDGKDLDLGFARATTSQLYTGLFVIAVPLFIWANPISSALWLVGATGRLFEEIDSDDDDGQGVTLDRSRFSDQLEFTGADMGRYTRTRRQHIQEPDSQSSEEEEAFDGQSSGTMQLALRNKEDILLQQALERIQRAQILGKRNVKLSQQEIEALEHKRRQDEARSTQVISGSPQAKRRRSSSQLKSATREFKLDARKSAGIGPNIERPYVSDERAGTLPSIMVPGPDGRPVHTPIGYYPVLTHQTPGSWGSRSGSRSGSSTNLPQLTPSLTSSQYWSPQPRHAPEIDHTPPLSAVRNSPSLRRLPDDPQWNPRPRSASSNQPSQVEQQYYKQYPPPAVSSVSQGRRIVSVPVEIQHPSLRRPIPISSAHTASPEPSLQRRAHSRGQQDHPVDTEKFEEEEEDYGVQVDVLPCSQGYGLRRGPEQVRPRAPRPSI
ncbi:MAG: hypothetical protein Q9209_006044 [Squamulea sp. 1 TL-2023]